VKFTESSARTQKVDQSGSHHAPGRPVRAPRVGPAGADSCGSARLSRPSYWTRRTVFAFAQCRSSW
jgi:hypothetical protein